MARPAEVPVKTLFSVGVVVTAVACGQMYAKPEPKQPPPEPMAGPPGEGSPAADPWTAASATPASAPDDRAAPAAPRDRAPVTKPAAKLPAVAQQLVDAHNRYRANHCAQPLTWSAELAAYAQKWATTLRDKGCAFEHSRGKYGENLAAGTTGAMDPEAVVAMWYDEIKGYSFKQPGFSMQTGHFTQVVWKGSRQLGCAMTQCKGMDLWVCEYDPPGNWEGQYRENVVPTSCK